MIAPPLPKPKPPTYARCLCGHIALMHGACGCEGCFTVIDEDAGIGESGACECREFVAADGRHHDCGPLCPTHGDPRDTSMGGAS